MSAMKCVSRIYLLFICSVKFDDKSMYIKIFGNHFEWNKLKKGGLEINLNVNTDFNCTTLIIAS